MLGWTRKWANPGRLHIVYDLSNSVHLQIKPVCTCIIVYAYTHSSFFIDVLYLLFMFLVYFQATEVRISDEEDEEDFDQILRCTELWKSESVWKL